MTSAAQIKKMKLVQLKKECEKQGLSKTGRKAELVKRLLENLKENEESKKPKGVPAEVPQAKKAAPAEKTEVASSNKAAATETKAAGGDSDEDKVAARKARFGTTSTDDKIKERQARFGTTKGSKLGISKEKLAARAKRFGIPPSQDASKLVSEDLKRKRMERFGIVDPVKRLSKRQKRFATGDSKPKTLPPLPKTDAEKEAAKKKMQARKDRFTTTTSDDKMKARQARFASS